VHWRVCTRYVQILGVFIQRTHATLDSGMGGSGTNPPKIQTTVLHSRGQSLLERF
jgi:hypothetical protein